MRFTRAVVGIIVTLGLQACTSIVTTPGTSNLHTYVQTSLSADVVVGEEIQGFATAKIILNLFTLGGPDNLADPQQDSLLGPSSMETLRAGARYAALTANKADLIVLPKYTTIVDDYFVFKDVKVTVKGFKGTLVKPITTKR